MKINKENYEAFFLDYHEGNLSPEMAAKVLLFLEEHPELKKDFESFELLEVTPLEMHYAEKEQLKKHPSTAILINQNNYEDFFVAAIEKDLEEEEVAALNKFLKEQPLYEKEFRLFKHTVLQSDKEIIFPNKLELKQIPYLNKNKIRPIYYYISAAASIVLILATFFLLQNNEPEKIIVDTSTVLNKSEITSAQNQLAVSEITPLEKEKIKSASSQNQRINSEVILPQQEITPIEEIKEIRVEKSQEEAFSDLKAALPIEAPSEEISLQATPKSTEKMKEDFVSLSDFVEVQLKEKVLNQGLNEEEAKNKKLSALDWVNLSLKGFKKITGKETDLMAKENEKGELTAINLTAGNFSFYRSKGR